MKVLIAEDDLISQTILKKFLEKWGFSVDVANDGQQAWEKFREGTYSLIVTDWMMPGIDGIQLIKRIRNLELPNYVYIIILTAKNQREDALEGLEAGADDFLSKPLDKDELRVRLNSARRILALEQALSEQNQKLQSVNLRMRNEVEAAARIQKSLLPPENVAAGKFELRWRFLPSSELAGDLLNIFMLDETRLGFYILDVAGHGVAAALLSVTLYHFIAPNTRHSLLLGDGNRSQAHFAELSPDQVLNRLNRQFQMDETSEQFFTLFYGILDTEQREIIYASAGHPAPVLAPRDAPPLSLSEKDLPAGILPELHYRVFQLRMKEGDRLYIFSDGVIEALNNSDKQFGAHRLLKLIEQGKNLPVGESLDAILDSVQQWCAPRNPTDDISLLAIEFAS